MPSPAASVEGVGGRAMGGGRKGVYPSVHIEALAVHHLASVILEGYHQPCSHV